MSKHDPNSIRRTKGSFKAASLKLDPSLIAIACHLARIAAEKDYKNISSGDAIPYTGPDRKVGPQ